MMEFKTERYRLFTGRYNYKYDLGNDKVYRFRGDSDANPTTIELDEPIETLEDFKKMIGFYESLLEAENK